METIKFSQLGIRQSFKFKPANPTRHIRIGPEKSGYGKDCPKCGCPNDAWINAAESGSLPLSGFYVHVCPDMKVYI